MAACRLSIELESEGLQLSRYFTISEACKPPHLRSDDDRKLSALTRRRKLRDTASLSPSFEQLSSDIARDFERLRYGSALRHKAGEFVRSSHVRPFW